MFLSLYSVKPPLSRGGYKQISSTIISKLFSNLYKICYNMLMKTFKFRIYPNKKAMLIMRET